MVPAGVVDGIGLALANNKQGSGLDDLLLHHPPATADWQLE
jgi:hypothetical protein